MACLGYTFTWCPGVPWSEGDTSAAITSSLYQTVTKSPLHTNFDEVASTFIVQIARSLSCLGSQDLVIGLAYIVANICRVRQLSVKELMAIKGYFEWWLQPCVAPSHLYILLTNTVSDKFAGNYIRIHGMTLVYGFSCLASNKMHGFEILPELS
jgi:hypothetical protein